MELPITIRSDDQSDVEVTFPNNVTESLRLVALQGNEYRVETSSVLAEPAVRYCDVIEIEPTLQRAALFKRIVKRSDFKVFDFIISQKIAESQELETLLLRVLQAGGNWERFFGGIFLVHLPKELQWDFNAELQELVRRFKS